MLAVGIAIAWASRVTLASLAFWAPYLTPDVLYGALWQFGRYPVGIYRQPIRFVLTYVLPVAFIATIGARPEPRGGPGRLRRGAGRGARVNRGRAARLERRSAPLYERDELIAAAGPREQQCSGRQACGGYDGGVSRVAGGEGRGARVPSGLRPRTGAAVAESVARCGPRGRNIAGEPATRAAPTCHVGPPAGVATLAYRPSIGG